MFWGYVLGYVSRGVEAEEEAARIQTNHPNQPNKEAGMSFYGLKYKNSSVFPGIL